MGGLYSKALVEKILTNCIKVQHRRASSKLLYVLLESFKELAG